MIFIKDFKDVLKITFVVIGSILGAGFASGKEFVTFFAKFNKLGVLGLFISCLIFFLFLISILQIIYKFNFTNYNKFITYLFGRRLGGVIAYLNATFLFTLFFVMISGGGATIVGLFPKLNYNFANIIFTIIIFISLKFGARGIVKINGVISPILIIGIIFFNIYLNFYNVPVFNILGIAYSSILYSSYNIISLIYLIFTMKNFIGNKKTCFLSAFLSSFIIFIIGWIILLPLIKNYNTLYNVDLPIIFLLEEKSFYFKYIYSIILFLAIFTTAVGSGFVFIDFLKNNIFKKFKFLEGVICFIAVIFSFFGFSFLVKKVYPLFGYFGVFQIIVIVLNFIYSI